MYRPQRPKIVAEFNAPDIDTLMREHGVGNLPRSAWVGKDWSKDFDQLHPTRTKFRIEQGKKAPLKPGLSEAVSRWHVDTMPGFGGLSLPTRTVIASFPYTTRTIQGVIPDLPSMFDGGAQELARLTVESYYGNETLQVLVEKAIEAGNAWVELLDNNKVYLLPSGFIHARTDETGLRIVGQSHPEIPYDPVWIAMNAHKLDEDQREPVSN